MDIIDKVNNYIKLGDDLEKELRVFVTDRNYPLDIRWNTFIQSDLGKNDPWIVHFNNEKMDNYICSSFEAERYNTVVMQDMYENMLDDLREVDDLGNEYYNTNRELGFSIKDVDEWREEVLEEFIKSFKMDW